MANVFIELAAFDFKKPVLEKLTNAADNKQIQDLINHFYDSQKEQLKDYCQLLIVLVSLAKTNEIKDKLLIALVYFIVHLQETDTILYLDTIKIMHETVLQKVKFFSHVFKSSKSQDVKKWLLSTTVQLITTIDNSDRISAYTNFIEHFDQLLDTLELTDEEALKIYTKLISYLEKHPVYKKLCSIYVIKSLKKVTDKTAETQVATSLVLKAIQYGSISESALSLLNHGPLQKNRAYSILEVLLTGDFQKLDMARVAEYEQKGINGEKILRKMKIQAIPRLLNNIKTASYSQVSQLLTIEKKEVQSYIIQAIKEGILQAKLDQFEESVIINRVNFRALRKEERAKLQKDITTICDKFSPQ